VVDITMERMTPSATGMMKIERNTTVISLWEQRVFWTISDLIRHRRRTHG
jgi:hypothetical protein